MHAIYGGCAADRCGRGVDDNCVHLWCSVAGGLRCWRSLLPLSSIQADGRMMVPAIAYYTRLVRRAILGDMSPRQNTPASSAVLKLFNARRTGECEVLWASHKTMFQGSTHQAR